VKANPRRKGKGSRDLIAVAVADAAAGEEEDVLRLHRALNARTN
jgi:hypothetical protein